MLTSVFLTSTLLQVRTYVIAVAPGLHREKLTFPADKGPISLVGLGKLPVWPPAADADAAWGKFFLATTARRLALGGWIMRCG